MKLTLATSAARQRSPQPKAARKLVVKAHAFARDALVFVRAFRLCLRPGEVTQLRLSDFTAVDRYWDAKIRFAKNDQTRAGATLRTTDSAPGVGDPISRLIARVRCLRKWLGFD